MKQPNEPNVPLHADHAGMRLLAVALVLAAFAIAADLTWMLPHVGPLYDQSRPREVAEASKAPSTADATPQSTYLSSQLEAQAKDEAHPPKF